VHHLGGQTEFVVNQKTGGGIWIHLGTFEFGKDGNGYVELTNRTPKGYDFKKGSVVTADAVRFGGGMGNIARSRKSKDGKEYESSVSGMARSAEGARYWLQWAGAESEVYSQNEESDDYRDDFMSRGDWVAWLSGGSSMNPKQKGKGIPVDLSLGFHSDAGVTPNDSIIGTLAIYTLKSEGIQKLPSGESRMTSREFADIIQSQIVNDIRAQHDSLWTRRQIWDRGYRESRTPTCPSMLLELLSHQNFADMKYGLDPAFRFTVGRAIYKGMLKYLSNRNGIPYTVQPLPVEEISVSFAPQARTGNSKAVIRWKKRLDPIEPTAVPTGYIIQTRVDDGAFDNGRVIGKINSQNGLLSTDVEIMKGHVYSFRITAFNEGGKSFPSETVSIGMPEDGENTSSKVLIVNNFDRISGPTWFDTPQYAGFDNRLDSGVPHIKDIAFIGEMYQNRRNQDWMSDDNPGFGASFNDKAGAIVAGNTFDYAATHGKAILEAGHSFYSCSNDAFCNDTTLRAGAWAIDLICGKQVTVTDARSNQNFCIFTQQIQEAVRRP
jgi:N-acetylmuramoyl-L-alanine amidase